MIRVLIADDHRLVRDGFRALLERERDIEVVGEARDGLEAMELAKQMAPDIILMDIQMPRLGGLEATRRLQGSGTNVLIVSMVSDERVVRQVKGYGIKGYLTKDEGFRELVNAVRAVHAGHTYYSRTIYEMFGPDGPSPPEAK